MTHYMTDIMTCNKQIRTRRHTSGQMLHTLMIISLMMVVGGGDVWADVSKGVYYIASDDVEGYVYNPEIPANNYYLVPAANPQQPHYADAYFHNQYCNTSGSGDYTDDNYGDPQKPFITTYKTNQNNNSLWVLQESGVSGVFYIVHVFTGKYVVYEPPYQEKINRKSMHLLSTDSPGANAKFAVTGSSSYQFRPQSITSGNRFFNPASGNRDQYYGTDNADKGAYWAGGIVGLYTAGSWKLETTLLNAPIISDVDVSNNTVTIADANGLPSGYEIRYTTDGSTPTASTGTVYSGPISITSSVTIKAVVVRYGIVLTEMASEVREPLPCATPIISFDYSTSMVSLTCATTSTTIYYTTNNSTPTASSTAYSGPFSVSSPTTIKAIATRTNWTNSDVATLTISQVATPTIQNNGSNAISITSATSGATIYYTTDGSDPTPSLSRRT